MTEANIQLMFSKALNIPGCYELKLAKGNSIPYDAVKPHQEEGLSKAKHTGLFHKISDHVWSPGRNKFTKPKPFDCFYLKGCPAYVAICFYKPRIQKTMYLIDIDRWFDAKAHDTRKSLTEQKANQIATYVIDL